MVPSRDPAIGCNLTQGQGWVSPLTPGKGGWNQAIQLSVEWTGLCLVSVHIHRQSGTEKAPLGDHGAQYGQPRELLYRA